MMPAEYVIVVDGELDVATSEAFDDLRIERGDGRSLLHTAMLDQAGLHGVLERLCAFGVALAGLERLASDESPLGG